MARRHPAARMLEQLDRLGQSGPFQLRLELLVRNNIATLERLRGLGLTWIQITRGLPNWKQKSGRQVTADQLRGVYARTTRKSAKPVPSQRGTSDHERPSFTPPDKGFRQPGRASDVVVSPQPELLRASLLRTKRVRG